MDTFISMMEHSLFHQNDNLEPTHLIMWAGHSSYQNDPTECKLYFEGLRKAIENYCLNNSCNLMEEYDKLINEPERGLTRIQQASAKLRNVFVKALLWC